MAPTLKHLVAAALVAPSLGLVVVSSSRLRPPTTQGTVSSTDVLLTHLEEVQNDCIKYGKCDVDEFVQVKKDLVREMHHFEHQLDVYADENLDVDDGGSSHSVETRALKRYIDDMRRLHGDIATKLAELDALLVKVRDCRPRATS